MPVSVHPPPGSGGLTPQGSPPSVELEVTVPGGGQFVALLVFPGGVVTLEQGLLAAGTTRLRVFLPASMPAGASLTLSLSDNSGCFGDFGYPVG